MGTEEARPDIRQSGSSGAPPLHRQGGAVGEMREHCELDLGVGVGNEAGRKRVGDLAVEDAAAVGDAQGGTGYRARVRAPGCVKGAEAAR